ncbi:chorismate synthase [bacterium]|nr:chorismate synthase [bacterium]
MSSSFGKNLKVTIFGESHGPAIGCVLTGFPAGFAPDMDKVNAFMQRRASRGQSGATARYEEDLPEVLSGLFEGKTCGTPIAAVIRNNNTQSQDYANLNVCPRPGHADFTWNAKTKGANDYRGGGHASGRLTAPMCFAGALAKQYLESQGVAVNASICSIKDHQISDNRDEFGLDEEAKKIIEEAQKAGDSVGGIIECAITGLPMGLGSPIFDGVENKLSQAIFGIPAVKGIEFGSGFQGTKLMGSQNNDAFTYQNGKPVTKTNNAGGILGGITNGMPVTFRVAIKPTPSIAKEQQTVDLDGKKDTSLEIKGRHDACIVPRALPVVEAIAALTALDLLLDAK